ncbi:hypothetical protein GCM10010387_16980 [Streptomyces inusitatus]|uniref:Uncharacterized protein n=1 Tax=Streptomyces inusitatus TaxID=68221 RepID=A0A918PV82_9ACTN|nr:hypothetical protein GCM10010387_16980 [Streptomyces inusitatus]
MGLHGLRRIPVLLLRVLLLRVPVAGRRLYGRAEASRETGRGLLRRPETGRRLIRRGRGRLRHGVRTSGRIGAGGDEQGSEPAVITW